MKPRRARALTTIGGSRFDKVCAGRSSASAHGPRATALPNTPLCPTTQVGELSSSYGCCASAYSLWGAGGHLCHNDTIFQRDIVRAWTRTIAYPSFCAAPDVVVVRAELHHRERWRWRRRLVSVSRTGPIVLTTTPDLRGAGPAAESHRPGAVGP